MYCKYSVGFGGIWYDIDTAVLSHQPPGYTDTNINPNLHQSHYHLNNYPHQFVNLAMEENETIEKV